MTAERRELAIDRQREERAGVRSQYVILEYLRTHPQSAWREEVESGRITIERAYDLMSELARDPKTGVLRADFLPYTLEYECLQSRESDEPLSIAVVDIDDFKHINSELDHTGADEVLQQVARIIAQEVRRSDEPVEYPASVNPESEPAEAVDETTARAGQDDAVVRWGGEEFVVVFAGASSGQARVAVERIRERIATALNGVRPNGRSVTVSAGLAEYSSVRHQDWPALLKDADQQLLRAKQNGKNVVYPE
ncbi:MAG: GGDEF domain-containing protein [Patescibacteria group bacterium]